MMLTPKCPECGSNSWQNPDSQLRKDPNIHRICDDCGREYFTDRDYVINLITKTSALDKQVGGDWYKNLKIQPVQFCRANKMGGLESSVVRYVTRHNLKNGRIDIEKAIHCLELILELDYAE